jgi:hypothetical protein
MTNGDSNSAARIKLDPQFSWAFDKQFLELRDRFVPSNNSEHMKKERKEKYPLSSQKNEGNDSTIAAEEVRNNTGEPEEKPPPSDNVQFEENESGHEEKYPLLPIIIQAYQPQILTPTWY